MKCIDQKKLAAYSLFYVVSLIIYVSLSYPGGLSVDSYEMLRQGVSHQYTNWHSPFLSMLWGWLYELFAHTGPIWFIQIGLYLLAVTTFCFFLKSLSLGLVGAIALAFFPPIAFNMHYLWKDCAAVIGTLFILSLAMHGEGKYGLIGRISIVVIATIVCLIRIDYFIIVLPLLFMACIKAQRTSRTLWRYRTIGIFIVILIVSNYAVNFLVSERLNPWYTIAIWDIAGVHKRMGIEGSRELATEVVVNDITGIEKYTCATSDELLFGPSPLFKVKTPYSEGKFSEALTAANLASLWKESLFNHPLLYVRHRLCVAKVFLGLKSGYIHGFLLPLTVVDDLHPTNFEVVELRNNRINVIGASYHAFIERNSFWTICLFKYYLYILLATVVAIVSGRVFSESRASYGLILLTIYLTAARFFILPASDFRYGLWIIVATLVMLLCFFDQWLRRRELLLSSSM